MDGIKDSGHPLAWLCGGITGEVLYSSDGAEAVVERIREKLIEYYLDQVERHPENEAHVEWAKQQAMALGAVKAGDANEG